MTISNDPNAKLSTVKDTKTRTNFEKPKSFWGIQSLNAAEKKALEFTKSHAGDIQAFLSTKTYDFVREWMQGSVDYYKEILAVNPAVDATTIRGIIKGQREMLEMLDYVKRSQIKKSEDK